STGKAPAIRISRPYEKTIPATSSPRTPAVCKNFSHAGLSKSRVCPMRNPCHFLAENPWSNSPTEGRLSPHPTRRLPPAIPSLPLPQGVVEGGGWVLSRAEPPVLPRNSPPWLPPPPPAPPPPPTRVSASVPAGCGPPWRLPPPARCPRPAAPR